MKNTSLVLEINQISKQLKPIDISTKISDLCELTLKIIRIINLDVFKLP